MGTPVWSHDGIICTGESYKSVVKLTFAKGASLKDPAKLFNSSLDGNTRRAIDIHEGEEVDSDAFKALINAAIALNTPAQKQGQSERNELRDSLPLWAGQMLRRSLALLPEFAITRVTAGARSQLLLRPMRLKRLFALRLRIFSRPVVIFTAVIGRRPVTLRSASPACCCWWERWYQSSSCCSCHSAGPSSAPWHPCRCPSWWCLACRSRLLYRSPGSPRSPASRAA